MTNEISNPNVKNLIFSHWVIWRSFELLIFDFGFVVNTVLSAGIETKEGLRFPGTCKQDSIYYLNRSYYIRYEINRQ